MKLAITFASILTATALSASAENYKVAEFTSQNSSSAALDQKWAQLVTEATGGKTTFEFFWSGSLGAGPEIVHLLSGGAIKIGGSAPAYYPSELPLAGLTNSLPAVFPDVETAMRLQRKLTTEHPQFLAEAERVGVYPIIQHGLTPSRLMCTKPVSTLADLSGLKVRTYGYFLPVAVTAIGMTPISVSISEIYEGLERGVIDCAAVSYATADAYKLEEVAKYWSDINLGAFSGPTVYASHNTYFNEWDETMRDIVNKASMEVFEEEIVQLAALEAKALAKAQEAGVEIVPFSEQAEVDAAIPDMLTLWEEKQVGDGMDPAIAAEIVSEVRAEIGG